MTTFDGIVELGALYHDGVALPRPTRPWIVDLSVLQPYPGLEPGNIAEFEATPDWSLWALADTPADPASRLRWIALRTEGLRLLICDRVILVRVSWQDLDEAGLVSGAPVVLDGGIVYVPAPFRRLRFQNGRRRLFRRGARDNEWDRFVVAEEAVAGLPPPSGRATWLNPFVRRNVWAAITVSGIGWARTAGPRCPLHGVHRRVAAAAMLPPTTST